MTGRLKPGISVKAANAQMKVVGEQFRRANPKWMDQKESVGVMPLQVNEVLSYYSMLHRKPLGKYHVQVCTNISCLLHDGDKLWEHACKKFGIGHKEVTADGAISLEEVECIGACSWAPALQINYDFHHKVTFEKLDKILDAL